MRGNSRLLWYKILCIVLYHIQIFSQGCDYMDCMNPMYAVKIGDKFRFVGAVNGTSQAKRKYLLSLQAIH